MQLVLFFKLFSSFFLGQKMTFFRNQKHVTIMLSFFHQNIPKYFLLFFRFDCTRVEKILRKWTKKMSKNEIDEILLGKFDAH